LEKEALLTVEPHAAKWIRPYLMGDEFINNIGRWCLWLVNIPPAELRAMPYVLKRIEGIRTMRESSTKPATRALANTPTLFGEIRQPKSKRYLAIPKVSSERRQFIPIGYLDSEVICGDKIFFVDDASLFTFGVLTSTMHNAWMRQTCGRLESRYSYSNTIAYNNFPWPGFAGEPLSDKHRSAIEQAAQSVLDTHAQFANSSLADLYDPLTMPPALLKAHQKLDTAVDAAYVPGGGKKAYASDAERVAFLFELYQRITSLLPAQAGRKTRKINVTESR
ncbi:MAG: type IIL restriction-modification enzyme MmeI, partial [Limnohabitans sp.]